MGEPAPSTPSSVIETFAPPEVLWFSSNPGVATVNSSGTVTAVAAGTATITAVSGGTVRSSVTVNVTAVSPQSLPRIGALRMIAPRVSNGTPQFDVNTASGASYILEYKDSLDDVEWKALSSFNGNGSNQTLTDLSPQTSQRFYRVRIHSSSSQGQLK